MLRVSGYGRTFDPVEHINPLMVLEGGKASHAVACCLDKRMISLSTRSLVAGDPGIDSGFMSGAFWRNFWRLLCCWGISFSCVLSFSLGRQSSEIAFFIVL